MRRKRGLYVITPEGLFDDRQLIQAVEQAIQGGAIWVQYRNKKSAAMERLAMAQALQALCEQYGVALMINDDISLCQRVGAAGVHLGRDDGSILAARQQLGKDKLIGVSCYNDVVLAEQAQQQGADYVAFGRFFASKTKPQAGLATTSVLQEAKKKLHLPVVAIGGITLDNGQALLDEGADILAVIQGVFATDDIMATAAQFTQWFLKDE